MQAPPPADRYASLDAAFTKAIVPELPSGLPVEKVGVASSIAELLAAQYGGRPVTEIEGTLAPTGPSQDDVAAAARRCVLPYRSRLLQLCGRDRKTPGWTKMKPG